MAVVLVMLVMIPVDCGYGSSSSDVSYDSSRLCLWQ